ncbi:MAG: flagellar basal body P-ring protein FlgI [Planctomycetia bacterium]|nr:flagellar basal body P-ring protein FlgI [Planctomycetia bacterium]
MKKPILFLLLILCFCLSTGCNKVPKNPLEEEKKKVLENKGRLIGDLAKASNVHLAKVEGVALIEGLSDTGADESPSNYYNMVLADLQRDIDKKKTARQRIESLSTAIVLLRAIVPPGAQKGDRLDVEVELQPNSTATSLEGGYIENASLHQYLAIDTIRSGDRLGIVNGFVVLDNDFIEKKSPQAFKKGKIIGGAVVIKDRHVWLTIKEKEQCVGIAKRIEDVINTRFSYKKPGVPGKRPVAEAKAGAVRVNIIVPDEYKDNVNRYMNVVRNLSFFETKDELQDRLATLKSKLLDPQNAELAAIQLEAVGPNNETAVNILKMGMKSSEPIVRFQSAVSMAYLNISKTRNETAVILAEFARDYPEYRLGALSVLGTCLKTSFVADEKLRELLSSDDQETRYGAFRALWTRNPKDYMIQGENLANQFSYHCLNCGGPPAVHVTQSKRPEIVLFSKDNIFLQGDFMLNAGSNISVRSEGSEIIVKRYKSTIDEQRMVSYRLDEVIRAIVEVGGTYPNVIEMLTEAKKKNVLISSYQQKVAPCELSFDALPGKTKSFREIRDSESVAMNEEVLTEKPKGSIWSKMNPQNWFSSDKSDENDDFSTEEAEKEDEESETKIY